MNKKNIVLSFIIITIILSLFPLTILSAAGKVPGKFIVKFKDNAKSMALPASLSGNNQFKKFNKSKFAPGLVKKDAFDHYYLFTTDNNALTIPQIVQAFGAEKIESIEPDYYLEFFDFPNDPMVNQQWYLNNYGQEYIGIKRIDGSFNDQQITKSGTAGHDIHLMNYYNAPPTEHTRVVVAIIDSGVDPIHPELAGQFWINEDEIPGNNIDDDHNGYIDDTLGFDISGDVRDILNPIGDNDPTDRNGHGSHIAGIIASRINNQGIVGVAPNALIMPVKIRPNGITSVAVEGILYAVNAGAKVINVSWGTPFESGLMKDAFAFARDNGVFVSFAAGNSGNAERFFPAAFDSTFVVGASNSDGYLTSFTTFGSHVDLVAPGEDILSIRAFDTDLYELKEPGTRFIGPDSMYLLADGTSMSAPMVAAAAALIWSVRPDLSRIELEDLLRSTANDLVDPFNQGDNLPGYDTLSGFGSLNIDAALAAIQPSGLAIIEPKRFVRYTNDVAVKVLPLGNYNGYWRLEYTLDDLWENWTILAEGSSIPSDSILFQFTDTTMTGKINLRLIDNNNSEIISSFYYVRHRQTKITAPSDLTDAVYNLPIYGYSYGPGFDSVALDAEHNNIANRLYSTTLESFGELIYDWTLSGIDTGLFKIIMTGYYEDGNTADTISVNIKSTFSVGWPNSIGSKGALSPVVADLNKDGNKEVVVTSGSGLFVFNADGTVVDGFPVNAEVDMRSIPAIYDVDKDGMDEIIATNADGIHVFNYDGSYAEGWPQDCETGLIPFGFAYPNPTVTRLGMDEDSAIVIINKFGQIMAYRFDGHSYFYSLEGLYSSFDPRISEFFQFGGSTSPFLTAIDFNNDGLNEVLAAYSSPYPYNGLGLFEGRTGLPFYDVSDPVIVRIASVTGTAISDFNDDGQPDILVNGTDELQNEIIWIKTNISNDLPGWPIVLPEVTSWIASPPIPADLDLDGIPEIVITYFEYDIGHLYIFRHDGTPYNQLEGEPYGLAYKEQLTFGIPTVADLTGDEYPEIIFRGGHIFPGSGPEKIIILDHTGSLIQGSPITTPASASSVLSSRFAPLVDDVDGDGLTELLIISDNNNLLMLDFDAAYNPNRHPGRFLMDNLNSNTYSLNRIPTDIVDTDHEIMPKTIYLSQNYPNPFNPTTTIFFDLPKSSDIKLSVYNILGQKVTQLADGYFPSGRHTVSFDGSQLASGFYFYQLKTDTHTINKKMVLVK